MTFMVRQKDLGALRRPKDILMVRNILQWKAQTILPSSLPLISICLYPLLTANLVKTDV